MGILLGAGKGLMATQAEVEYFPKSLSVEGVRILELADWPKRAPLAFYPKNLGIYWTESLFRETQPPLAS